MKEKNRKLEKEIGSGNIERVYLLTGEEAYLREYYRDVIRKALIPEGDTINLQIYRGEKTDPQEVIAQADTLPFLGEHRLLILEDTGFFKRSCEELAEYIPRIPKETVIVFSEKAADKRQKLYKAVEQTGWVQECGHPKRDVMSRWIVGALAKRHVGITQQAMERLLDVVDGDMCLAVQEMEKLCAYTQGREGIRLPDVEAVCPVPVRDKLFDMIRAIAAGDTEETLRLYHDLLELQTKPLSILYNLQKEFREMLLVQDLRLQGCSLDVISRRTGKASWMVSKMLGRAEPFTPDRIRGVLAACARTEEAVKTGKIRDQVGVETLIVQVSGRGGM